MMHLLNAYVSFFNFDIALRLPAETMYIQIISPSKNSILLYKAAFFCLTRTIVRTLI